MKKIDTTHKPWKFYHGKKDLIETTHRIIQHDYFSGLYNTAIEVSKKEMKSLEQLMTKEVDAANRFSVTDGIIQGEFEIWDGDYSESLYFCVDFTLAQAIKFTQSNNSFIGYVTVGSNEIIIGGQRVFAMADLYQIILTKRQGDRKPLSHRWKKDTPLDTEKLRDMK